ncbi:CidA/LrgA family protein [Sutcliffiella halmapala]|uniref:CidA/LrgA family protein n=1 Tax=Sutcliffiella halmapala TaxID=79882 RepID=UPI000994D5A1|nr:CidA/LrgA family protein [Sutcliffiella halmapala]
MKGIKLVLQIAILYLFYQVGLFIQDILAIPVPGSIIGMLLLFILLVTGIIKEEYLGNAANSLLLYMPLFFVPATVGVMNYFDVFLGKGFFLLLALLLSTLLIMGTAGVVSQKTVAYVDNKTWGKKRGL